MSFCTKELELGMFIYNKREGERRYEEGRVKRTEEFFSGTQWQDHGHKTETQEDPS